MGARLFRRVLVFTVVDERVAKRALPLDDVKTVIGDFNARLDKEGILSVNVGKFSSHDETSPNGL